MTGISLVNEVSKGGITKQFFCSHGRSVLGGMGGREINSFKLLYFKTENVSFREKPFLRGTGRNGAP